MFRKKALYTPLVLDLVLGDIAALEMAFVTLWNVQHLAQTTDPARTVTSGTETNISHVILDTLLETLST